jgi:hypothetical protein
MDETIKEVGQIITGVKKGRGRPREWIKCPACKAWIKIGNLHECKGETSST